MRNRMRRFRGSSQRGRGGVGVKFEAGGFQATRQHTPMIEWISGDYRRRFYTIIPLILRHIDMVPGTV